MDWQDQLNILRRIRRLRRHRKQEMLLGQVVRVRRPAARQLPGDKSPGARRCDKGRKPGTEVSFANVFVACTRSGTIFVSPSD
jgi:hypothetical protein